MSRRGSELVMGAIKSYVGAIGLQFDYGEISGTTITFKHKFKERPVVHVTAVAATGTPESHVVSVNKVGDWYTTATITNAGCDYVGWDAKGLGIVA